MKIEIIKYNLKWVSILLLFLSLFILLLCNKSFCDEILIPFECYPQKIQGQLAERNIKIDLTGSERTEDSWGFIDNKGAFYNIVTYKSVTPEELDMIMEIVMGKETVEKRKRWEKEEKAKELIGAGKIKEAKELLAELEAERG